jgi:hypothetical protein
MDSPWILYIDLILLLATVLLVLLVWWRVAQSEPEEPVSTPPPPPPNYLPDWKALQQELWQISEQCAVIAKKIPRPQAESPLMTQLSSVYVAFEKWRDAVRRSMRYAAVYEADLLRAERDYSSCMEQVSLMRGLRVDPRFEEKVRESVLDLVKSAVQLTDRDLDRDRVDGGLQHRLGELVKSAKCELVSPQRGQTHQPRGGRKIKVGAVHVRGLRDGSSKIFLEPEIEEMR